MKLAFILAFAFAFAQDKRRVPQEESVEINAEDERSQLMKEWDEHMVGFVPSDMVTFELPARGEEIFFETIDVIPSKIRGAWFITSKESRDIEFSIMNPNMKVIFEKKKKSEALFYFDAEQVGIYTFKFKNTKVIQKHVVTFALNCGNSTDEVLKTEHLTPLEKQLVDIQKEIKDFQVDNQFAQLRQESHYRTMADSNRNVFIFSILESLGVIAVSAWQAYYIKKLLDNRRIL
ncbi:unnamed protein product [Blepharisma stoltei]|uniref:GOLD domain-containing protein n=1 Tax=Blepharisma stoltei TaxID=1481888 RepID=A0AAU9IVI8_9CILI|nr:unnamed protein product [Blepharisma stoltei]